MAHESREFVAYLADAREVTDSAAGQPISGPVTLQLDLGTYDLSVYSPVTGGYSPAIRLPAGTQATINLQPFQHDIVLRVRRVS